jgi:hypothetical protein
VALLLLFHVDLLVAQALDGRLLEPATLLRWTIGGLLLAGFVAVQRVGMPVIRGREAAVFWLLVALLHGPAALRSEASGAEVRPVAATLATSVVALGGALLGALALAGLNRRQGHTPPFPSTGRLQTDRPIDRTASPFRLALAPRPPPAA